jgi:glycerol-3-phosphate O-acyltransferase
VIYQTVGKIVRDSTDGVTCAGLEAIDVNAGSVFITNHRDIVLDSALLNYLLFGSKLDTTYIAIGDNLLRINWVKDLVRLNKSFIVKRNLQKHDMLLASKKLSAYIRHLVVEEKKYIWIAQREGRTKNGIDATQPGVLKMLNMSSEMDLVDAFRQLNIIPISISYEIEPCERFKVAEQKARLEEGKYLKSPEEDIKSMYSGIVDPKGRVHFGFGKSLNQFLPEVDRNQSKNDQIQQITEFLDQQIKLNYKIWPGNYIALDLLQEKNEFEHLYTPEQKEKFIETMNQKLMGFSSEISHRLYLEIYANPLLSRNIIESA